MATYQHVLPGMQAEAARTFAALLERPTSSALIVEPNRSPDSPRWNTRGERDGDANKVMSTSP
jgi:hypothetical protein